MGLVELRTYTLHPGGFAKWMELTEEAAELRNASLPAFRAMFTCESGGVLNRVTHLYVYSSWAERVAARSALLDNAAWTNYVTSVRPFVQTQESELLLESSDVHKATGIPPAASFASTSGPSLYELRSYQLELGYNPVPALRKAFVVGVPAKQAALAEGRLVLVAASEVGVLNRVYELWRFRDMESCLAARQAARTVPEWNACIGSIAPSVQSFQTQLLVPTSFSPWR